jgi:hypothetical protein
VVAAGYRTTPSGEPAVEPCLEDKAWASRLSVSLSELAFEPFRLRTENESFLDEETGEVIEFRVEKPIWVEPLAEGERATAAALQFAYELVADWIARRPDGVPPVVVHLTDGVGDPEGSVRAADAIMGLQTSQGHVLLLTDAVSAAAEGTRVFPTLGDMPVTDADRLFLRMSSVLPEPIFREAVERGFELEPGARACCLNSTQSTSLFLLGWPHDMESSSGIAVWSRRPLLDVLRTVCQAGNRDAIAAMADSFSTLMSGSRGDCISDEKLGLEQLLVTNERDVRPLDGGRFHLSHPAWKASGGGDSPAGSRGHLVPSRPDVQNFSPFLVYTVLRALAASPALCEKYAAQPPGGLLLQQTDFDSPEQSAAFQALRTSPDPAVRRMVRLLLAAVGGRSRSLPKPRPLTAGSILFLVDQSFAMRGPLPPHGRRKCAVVEAAINELLPELSDAFPLDLVVIGYRSNAEGLAEVACRWNGPWTGRTFVRSDEFQGVEACWPYRLVTSGNASQVAAFEFCCELLESRAGFVASDADPPLVVHISAGGSQDGNPAKAIKRLQEMEPPCGRPIILQIRMAGRESAPEATRFPSAAEPSQPRSCRDLFARSSELPDALVRILKDQGVPVAAAARGLIYNAREDDLKLLLSAVRSLAQTAFWSRTQACWLQVLARPDPAEVRQSQDLVGMLLTAGAPLPARVLCEAAEADAAAWDALAKHLGEFLVCRHDDAAGEGTYEIESEPIAGYLRRIAKLDLDRCQSRWLDRCGAWYSRPGTVECGYAVKHGTPLALASQRWDLLEAWLTDFAVVEAKCRAGLAYELMDEYLQTLAALPDEQGDPLQRWREDSDGARSLLDNMVAAEEAAKAGHDLFATDDPWGRIEAFASFLRYNVHHLDKKPEDVAELASEQVSTAFLNSG